MRQNLSKESFQVYTKLGLADIYFLKYGWETKEHIFYIYKDDDLLKKFVNSRFMMKIYFPEIVRIAKGKRVFKVVNRCLKFGGKPIYDFGLITFIYGETNILNIVKERSDIPEKDKEKTITLLEKYTKT
jgi:hypothetical protein